MKIAIVHEPWTSLHPPAQGGSLAILTYEISRRISDRADITTYSARSRRGDSGFESYEGVDYRRLPVTADRRWVGILRRLSGLGLIESPYYWSPRFYRRYRRRVAQDLARLRPDIVHVHNLAAFVPAMRAAVPGAKIVLHMHCDWLSVLDPELTGRYLEAVDLALFCSDHVRESAERQFPALDARTLHNGVDSGRFRTAPEGEQEPEILFVSRLSPEKGAHDLCQAFNILGPKYPDWKLTLIGPSWVAPREFIVDCARDPLVRALDRFYPGDYLRHCEGIVDAGLGDRVSFTSFVPHDELPERFARASIVVQPSLWEPFGMCIVEGMAAARPLVVTRVMGMPEIVVEGETGLIVEPGDPPALAAALSRLIEAPDERARMGAAGRARAERRFDFDAMAGRYLEFCTELLARPG